MPRAPQFAALLVLALLPRAVGQPFALLSWVRTGVADNAAPVTYSVDGGASYATATAPGGSSFQFGLSSPSGGACLTFYRSAAGAYGMLQWSPSAAAWATYHAPGFPATVTSLYAGDMNINRAAWVGALDSAAGHVMYVWTSGGAPFFLADASASAFCAGYQLGAIGSLPSLGALAAMAVPPYRVSLWASSGASASCRGSVDLVGGSASQVWDFASTSTATPYSITDYAVLAASGPIGCGRGAACPAAAAGGRLYAIRVAGAADSAMLTAANWASFAMPSGGGVNLLGCHFSLATSNPAYCYAAASWNPPASVYSGACAAGSSGYSFYTSGSADPTAPGSWAEVGCAPLIAQAMVVVDYSSVYLSGFALGSSSSAVVAYWSSTSGASWSQLALPASVTAAGSAGAGLRVLQMSGAGGPVLLSGMDPSLHCQLTLGSNYYYSTSTCVTATMLGISDCNSVLKIATVALAGSRRGDATAVAFLGTYMPASSATPQRGNSFLGWMLTACTGWSTTFYSTAYASQAQSNGGGTIATFFALLAAGTIRPRLVVVAEVDKSYNGIKQVDMSAIDAHRLALARYVSTGGALYVLGFQGPYTGSTANGASSTTSGLNFGFLATLTPGLATKEVSGSTPAVTPAGSANFPSLSSSDIASPWHTSFGGGGYGACGACSFGVLTCLAYETLGGVDECALVGGASIAFNYGTQPQSIACSALGGPYWGYHGAAGVPVACAASSGLSVTVASTSPGACTYVAAPFPGTYSAGYVNATAAGGMCSLTVSQAGDSVYAAAAPVTLSALFGPLSTSPTLTPSVSASPARSQAASRSGPPSSCASACSSASVSATPSGCTSASRAPTLSAARSPSPSPSSTTCGSASRSASPSPSPPRGSASPSPSRSPSASASPSSARSASPSPSRASPSTATSHSPSRTASPSSTSTASPSRSSAASPSMPSSPSARSTLSTFGTPSVTGTPSRSATLSACPSASLSSTGSATPSPAWGGATGSACASGSLSPSPSHLATPSASASALPSPTASALLTPSGSASGSPSACPSFSPLPSLSALPSAPPSPTPTAFSSASATATATGTHSQWRSASGAPLSPAPTLSLGALPPSPTPSASAAAPYRLVFDLALPGGTMDMIVGTPLGEQLLAAITSVALAAVASTGLAPPVPAPLLNLNASGYNSTLGLNTTLSLNATLALNASATNATSTAASSSDWLPVLSSVQQYTSSDPASTGRLMTSSQSGSSAGGTSSSGIDQSNLTATLASSGLLPLGGGWAPPVQPRRLARRGLQGSATTNGSSSDNSSAAGAATPPSVCGGYESMVPSSNSSTVLRVGVALSPPLSLISALVAGGISGAELAVLVQSTMLSAPSPTLTAFQRALTACTRSNYSALLLGGVGAVSVEGGGGGAVAATALLSQPPALLGLLGLLGLPLCCCAMAWLWCGGLLPSVRRRKAAAAAAAETPTLTIAYDSPAMHAIAKALQAALREPDSAGSSAAQSRAIFADVRPVAQGTLLQLPKSAAHPVVFLLHCGAGREAGALLLSSVAEAQESGTTSSSLDLSPLHGMYFMVRVGACSEACCSSSSSSSIISSSSVDAATPSFFFSMLMSLGASELAPLSIEAPVGSASRVQEQAEWVRSALAAAVAQDKVKAVAEAAAAQVCVGGLDGADSASCLPPAPAPMPAPTPAPAPILAPAPALELPASTPLPPPLPLLLPGYRDGIHLTVGAGGCVVSNLSQRAPVGVRQGGARTSLGAAPSPIGGTAAAAVAAGSPLGSPASGAAALGSASPPLVQAAAPLQAAARAAAAAAAEYTDAPFFPAEAAAPATAAAPAAPLPAPSPRAPPLALSLEPRPPPGLPGAAAAGAPQRGLSAERLPRPAASPRQRDPVTVRRQAAVAADATWAVARVAAAASAAASGGGGGRRGAARAARSESPRQGSVSSAGSAAQAALLAAQAGAQRSGGGSAGSAAEQVHID